MLIIYCDSIIDSENGICVWSCLIQYKNREYKHSGHVFKDVSPHYAELWAVIKSLGMTKSFKIKEIEVYSDFKEVPEINRRLANQRIRKQVLKDLVGDFKAFYPLLLEYTAKYKITLIKLSQDGNPAHEIAVSELENAISKMAQE